ncbi:hypothetical protein [Clostridium estertheticum]|uniref:hypothetical protein n=1 Tax=Clostridium estertheticum TaxID=238834 RepID=UPI001C6DDE25|nr:hypothetical protein [Clostridium estertheticum]MBW9153518.1 hypothetical protein [Clostridium estertheticum]
MEANGIDSKRNYSIILIIIIIIIVAVSVYKDISYKHNKYVNINDLVNKAYTSSKGYDSDIAKHISKDVFDSANLYIAYEHYECKRPIKISLKLTEINQHKINGKIFVYMIYDFDVIDAKGVAVAGSRNSDVVFTVTGTNNDLYIENSFEYMTGEKDVPKIYK